MSNPFNPGELTDFDLLEQRPFEQADYDILKSYEAVVLVFDVELLDIKAAPKADEKAQAPAAAEKKAQ
ncbi:hypothetical protein CRX72_26190 [Pantoea sp. BRM17]|nr:hypothetical protein CRX72_26190 [Pantoea sp. BRM17]